MSEPERVCSNCSKWSYSRMTMGHCALTKLLTRRSDTCDGFELRSDYRDPDEIEAETDAFIERLRKRNE